jgi:general secretion pathway protein G
MSQRRSGFTLIELLVVIAIIGILATLVVVAVNGAQVRARNSQAKNDVTQIGKAIELFKVNQTPATMPSGTDTSVVGTRRATLTTTSSGTTVVGNFTTLFGGTESATAYGIRIAATPTGLIYRYVTANPAGNDYAVWSTVSTTSGVNDNSICVHNGSTLNGSSATAAPTATGINCDTDVVP